MSYMVRKTARKTMQTDPHALPRSPGVPGQPCCGHTCLVTGISQPAWPLIVFALPHSCFMYSCTHNHVGMWWSQADIYRVSSAGTDFTVLPQGCRRRALILAPHAWSVALFSPDEFTIIALNMHNSNQTSQVVLWKYTVEMGSPVFLHPS